MPIDYEIDERNGVVHTTARGVLNEEEVLELKSRLVQDPRFRPGMRELSDVRAVTKLEVRPQSIGLFVEHDHVSGPRLEDHKLAIVVSDERVYAMARRYEFKSKTSSVPSGQKGIQVRIFRHLDSARAWLGLEET